jgi:MYXO-CTERM domain-containing protein
MKRTVQNVLVAVATLTVVTAGPVAAAPAEAPVTVLAQQENSGHEDDDDAGLWGLLGLLGLVGLVGLIRRGRAGDRLAGPAATDPAQPPRDGGFRQS